MNENEVKHILRTLKILASDTWTNFELGVWELAIEDEHVFFYESNSYGNS